MAKTNLEAPGNYMLGLICLNRSYRKSKEEQRGGYQLPGTYAISTDDYDFTAQLSVGNKHFPDYPRANPGEMHESTLRALGVHASSHISTSLRAAEYRDGSNFVLGFNLERSPMFATYTGLSTKQGEQIQVRLNGMVHDGNNGSNAYNAMTQAFCTLEHDLSIKQSGVYIEY